MFLHLFIVATYRRFSHMLLIIPVSVLEAHAHYMWFSSSSVNWSYGIEPCESVQVYGIARFIILVLCSTLSIAEVNIRVYDASRSLCQSSGDWLSLAHTGIFIITCFIFPRDDGWYRMRVIFKTLLVSWRALKHPKLYKVPQLNVLCLLQY